MGYFSMRMRQILGKHHSNLTVLLFRKTGDPSSPEETDLPVHTAEQGRLIVEEFHKDPGLERVELVDTKTGEVLYARGYRSQPEVPVRRGSDEQVPLNFK